MSVPITRISVEEALALGKRFPIFPCDDEKKPRTRNGFKDASTDPETIRRWWSMWPDALVGVPTGSASRANVLDVDPRNLTDISRAWLTDHIDLLLSTRIHHTPNDDGRHYWFIGREGIRTRCCAGVKVNGIHLPGIDIRGDGGYVIHWGAHGLPSEGKAKPIPDALLPLFVAPTSSKTNGSHAGTEGSVPQGQRNNFLSREGYRLRKQGSTVDQMKAVLHALNDGRCVPPLDRAEVDKIAVGKEGIEPSQESDTAAWAPLGSYKDEPQAQPKPRGQGDARADRGEAHEPRPFTLNWYATLDTAVQQPQLIRGLLLAGSLFEIYGEANSGKTFLALDIALAIASGTPWRGRRVTQGPVLYIAGEGAASVRNRVVAYRQAHPELPGDVPFAIIPHAVNFMDATAIDLLIVTLLAVHLKTDVLPVALIVDTLARNMAGGDENGPKDMGIVIGNADRVRAATGVAVGVLHHCGKDTTKGSRGHSSLRGAVDTEILVEGQSGVRTVTIPKQRDLPTDPPFTFELVPAVIGRADEADGSGDITSCTVRYTGAEPQHTAKGKGGGANQQKVMIAFTEWCRANAGADHITSFAIRALLKAQGLGRQRRHDALLHLTKIRVLTPSVGGYTVDRSML